VINSNGDLTLQLAGQRRPWGSPAISVSAKLPRKLDDPVLSFRYQIPTDGQALVLTIISRGGRGEPSVLARVWQSEGTTSTWERVWFDASPYLGKQVEIIFSLEGPKGAPPGIVQIDDVTLGSLPSQ
jgi:hypothetical protein